MTFPESTREFQQGLAARTDGSGRDACPYRSIRIRYLWLCGWHTADMELTA